ncbi:DUF2065 family protein [Alphaproteobacteria bacterium]|nr:DUF2065 family protein [Alphaproteobacteria bacterium]MDC0131351.1 DUF2065 family protein [Alphaproteobacteria bacterium]
MLEKLVLALGLVLALEGALLALFPTKLRSMLTRIQTVSEYHLRLGGMLSLGVGVVLVWLIG